MRKAQSPAIACVWTSLKRSAISAFRDLQFQTMAMGDSYNDIAMLERADTGVLFDPPDNVIDDHPNLPVVRKL